MSTAVKSQPQPMVPRIAPREDLNPFRIAQIQFDMAAEYLKLDLGLRQVLRTPKRISKAELERMTRRYASEILPIIGPDKDIPAPDVYTDSQTMAWIMDTYSMMVGHSTLGVVTGKPVSIGGSVGRHEATARGCLFVAEEACKAKKMPLRGATVAVQGFGNAGSIAARLFAEKRSEIVAISDSRGGVTNPRGLDPIKALRYKERSGTVVGMPGASRISNDDLLTMKCDILVPAALENVIDRKSTR